jgi:hypothetical protein
MATTDIFQKCLPPVRTNIETCGLMTVCDAAVPAPEDLDGMFKDGSSYRVMEALFMHDMELKACKARQYNLYDFFAARKVNLSHKLNSQRINSGLIKIAPYVLAQRKAPINNNYWQVTGGLACLVNGTPDAGGTYWRVDLTSDDTSIPAAANWFNAGERLFIKSISGGGSVTNTAWLIVSSSVVGSANRVVLSSQNDGSFLPAANLESPVTGVAERGTANVNAYESFCSKPPGLITSSLDPFWVEETRSVFCEDEKYREWRDLVFANNPLYAKFYDLPTVEYNRQVGEDFQRRWVNNILRNKPLANQTLSSVDQLETINGTAPDGSYCVGKRANATGIYEQHAELNRVVDLQGGTLNLPALFTALYQMQRLRETVGHPNPNVFECFMPSQFYPVFHAAMLAYIKAQSGNPTFFLDITGGFKKSTMGFTYMDYPLIWPAGVTLRVVFDKYFDDYYNANVRAGQADAGRQLWIVDWSTIYPGVFNSERVVNVTGDLKTLAAVNNDYACIGKVAKKTTTLTMFSYTVVCECPQAGLIIENFAATQPEHSTEVGTYGGECTTTTSTTTAAIT